MTEKTGWPFGDSRRALHYTIDGEPIEHPIDWAAYVDCLRQSGKNRIARTFIGRTMVSTVYVGIDMAAWSPIPYIFETMVFDDGEPIHCERWPSKETARLGHRSMIREFERGEAEWMSTIRSG